MMGMGAPDQAKIDEQLKNFRRWGAVLNARLDGKSYVVGNSLTLADLTLGSSLMYAKQAEVPVAEFQHIEAWFGRVTALDGWKQSA